MPEKGRSQNRNSVSGQARNLECVWPALGRRVVSQLDATGHLWRQGREGTRVVRVKAAGWLDARAASK